MARFVDIHEAQAHLSRLLEEVRQGEEIVIVRSGRPVARLVAVTERPERRVPGSARGLVNISPDFDDPLSEDVLETFEH